MNENKENTFVSDCFWTLSMPVLAIVKNTIWIDYVFLSVFTEWFGQHDHRMVLPSFSFVTQMSIAKMVLLFMSVFIHGYLYVVLFHRS